MPLPESILNLKSVIAEGGNGLVQSDKKYEQIREGNVGKQLNYCYHHVTAEVSLISSAVSVQCSVSGAVRAVMGGYMSVRGSPAESRPLLRNWLVSRDSRNSQDLDDDDEVFLQEGEWKV